MTTTVARPSLASLFQDYAAAANAVLVERETEVAVFVNALLSRSHVFFLSDPGAAKTLLSRIMVALIGDLGPEDYFQVELGRYSDPSEFLGPHHPGLLKEGRFERDTTLMMPRAKIAHIGEIGNANSATANYLRSMMTERRFKNGRRMEPANLVTLVCDSNDTLEATADLRAFWDRLTFRVVTRPVQGRGNRKTMLRGGVARRTATGSSAEPNVSPVISWHAVVEAQDQVRQVHLPETVYDGLCDLQATLAAKGVHPSDRRLVDATAVIQAAAFLAGRDVATLKDMSLLAHVLWTRRADAETVADAVYGIASPQDARASALNRDVQSSFAASVRAIERAEPSPSRRREAVEAHKKLTQAADDLVAIRDAARAEGTRLELFPALSAQIMGLTRRLKTVIDSDLP